MNRAAYLDADASALADREDTNTSTNTNTAARLGPLSDSHLQELEYAADLFRRGSSDLAAELPFVEGIDAPVDWKAVDAACRTILHAAAVMHIRALCERSRRAS